MSGFIKLVSMGVTVSGASVILCIAIWLACEVFLRVEDRIFSIFRVQPKIYGYLVQMKLYDKLMDDHKAAAARKSR